MLCGKKMCGEVEGRRVLGEGQGGRRGRVDGGMAGGERIFKPVN